MSLVYRFWNHWRVQAYRIYSGHTAHISTNTAQTRLELTGVSSEVSESRSSSCGTYKIACNPNLSRFLLKITSGCNNVLNCNLWLRAEVGSVKGVDLGKSKPIQLNGLLQKLRVLSVESWLDLVAGADAWPLKGFRI